MRVFFLICLLALADLRAEEPCPAGNLMSRARISGERFVHHASRVSDGDLAPEGDAWDGEKSAVFARESGEIVHDLGAVFPLRAVFLQADNNDEYLVEFSPDGLSFETFWTARPVPGGGLRRRVGDGEASRARFVRLRAGAGDGLYGVSELQVYCVAPAPYPVSPARPVSPQADRTPLSFRVMGLSVSLLLASFLLYPFYFRRRNGSMTGLGAEFRDGYLTIDGRTLGVFRILFGVLLIWDLLRRVADLSVWYSDEGLLPSHLRLWSYAEGPLFSFFRLAETPEQAALGFFVCFAAYCGLVAGYRTKAFQVAAFLCVVSLHNRVNSVENGGDVVIRLLAAWTLFLPLGSRFSLDARRRPFPQRTTSIAVLGLYLQLAVVYAFNVLHKHGPTWDEGTAVHYVLYQERIATVFAHWFRDTAPVWLLRAGSYGTLIAEGFAPLALLSPFWTRKSRHAIALLLLLMHATFALFLNLGLFSVAMMVFFSLLLSGDRSTAGEAAAGSRPANLFREGLALFFFVVFLSQVLNQNRIVPRFFRHTQPALFKAVVQLPSLAQGWGMFAPDAPVSDKMLVVEARTADGRMIDPFNEAARGVAEPHRGEGIPGPLGLDEFWCDYSAKIDGDNPPYHEAFRKWILNYHVRTGRPRDEIVSFRAYTLLQKSPPPGSREGRDFVRRPFLSHPP